MESVAHSVLATVQAVVAEIVPDVPAGLLVLLVLLAWAWAAMQVRRLIEGRGRKPRSSNG